MVQSEEATEGLCAPGTHNTSKAQYFALVYFKGDIPYLFTALEMFHLQDDLSSMKIPGRMDIGDLPANHHGDQLVVIQFLNCTGSYVFSIPQYGDPVCYMEYLIDLMGDDNNGNTLTLQFFNEGKQFLDFPLRDGRSRFVHDDKLRIIGDRFQDFQHLRLSSRQSADFLFRVEIHLPVLEELSALVIHGAPVYKAALLRIPSHKHILSDRQILNGIELLMDHGDPQGSCVSGISDGDFFSVETDITTVRRDHSVQNLHQC